MKKAGHIARENLLSFGTCFGKFTKTSKFRLHVTALDYLAPYAKVCYIFYVIIYFILFIFKFYLNYYMSGMKQSGFAGISVNCTN